MYVLEWAENPGMQLGIVAGEIWKTGFKTRFDAGFSTVSEKGLLGLDLNDLSSPTSSPIKGKGIN